MRDPAEVEQAAMQAWVMARAIELRLDGVDLVTAHSRARGEARAKFHSIGVGIVG